MAKHLLLIQKNEANIASDLILIQENEANIANHLVLIQKNEATITGEFFENKGEKIKIINKSFSSVFA